MLKQPAVRAAVLGVALIGSATAFYFIAPVFVRDAPIDGYPTLAYIPTRTPRLTSLLTDTPTANLTPTEGGELTMLEDQQSLLLYSGAFESGNYNGRGNASVYVVAENKVVLRLEDFEVEDGPDLHVYLTDEPPVAGAPLADAVDLGELKGLVGDQAYDLPEDLWVESYYYVVIWCVPYNVPFLTAALQIP